MILLINFFFNCYFGPHLAKKIKERQKYDRHKNTIKNRWYGSNRHLCIDFRFDAALLDCFKFYLKGKSSNQND